MSILEQCKQEGHQQGILAGESTLLLELLEYKFDNIPAHIRAKITQANQKQLESWAKNILKMDTMEEIFNDQSVAVGHR